VTTKHFDLYSPPGKVSLSERIELFEDDLNPDPEYPFSVVLELKPDPSRHWGGDGYRYFLTITTTIEAVLLFPVQSE
jgi:hypothetical protein